MLPPSLRQPTPVDPTPSGRSLFVTAKFGPGPVGGVRIPAREYSLTDRGRYGHPSSGEIAPHREMDSVIVSGDSSPVGNEPVMDFTGRPVPVMTTGCGHRQRI